MFIIVDARMRRVPAVDDFIWQRLWEMRSLVPVSGMLPASVSSPCPLLPDEAADAVLDGSGVQVPVDTAWVPAELDLGDYATAHGELRLERLEQELGRCVEFGEAEHDERTWATPALRRDSRLNRRLAIRVRGWGTVVARRGADPACLETLRDLEQLAAHVRAVLLASSRRIAAERGHCGALEVDGRCASRHGGELHARWRHALDANGLRHRNLLTLSPWDVFPVSKPADTRYQDLLPLLACADSVSFRRGVDIDHWNVIEFKHFHDRVGAILRQNCELPLIAEQV